MMLEAGSLLDKGLAERNSPLAGVPAQEVWFHADLLPAVVREGATG